MPSSNASQKKRSHKGAFPLRLAVLGIAALVLVPVLAVLALHIPAVQNEIIHRVVGEIEKATQYKVELASYRWWPFSRLYLDNVKVEADGRKILDCEAARLSYSLTPSWPYVNVEEIYLEKPFLQLERNAEGKWRVPVRPVAVPGGDSAGGDPLWSRIPLPTLRIVSGTVEARQQGKIVLSIKDVTGVLLLKTVQGPGGPEIRVDFDNWQAQADIEGLGTWSIAGSALLGQDEAATEGIILSAPEGTRIELRGHWNIASFENGKSEILVSGFRASAVPDLPAAFSRLDGAKGRLTLVREGGRWSLDHDIETPAGLVKGHLRVEKTAPGPYEVVLDSGFSSLRPPGLPYAPEMELNGRLGLTARVEEGRISGTRFTVLLDSGKIGAETVQKCELAGTFEKDVLSIKSGSVKSSVADFKLTASADLGGLFDASRKGGVRAEIAIERANLEKIHSKVQQRLGGVVALEADYDPGNFRDLRLWRGKIDANLNIPELIALKGSGAYRNEQLKVEYDLDCKETQRFATLLPKWQGKGRVVSRGTFSGKWPDLLWEGDLSSPRLQYGAVQADQITLKGKGKFATKEDRREISLKAQNIVVDGKNISSLNLDLDQQKDGCSFQLKSDGILGQLTARLSGRVGNIWEFPLVTVSTQGQLGWKDQSGAFEAKFEIEKDGLKISSASLQQGKQKLVVSGGTISDAKTDLRLAVESVNAGPIVAALGFKNVFSGLVSGQIQVSGRPEQPECKLTMQASNCLLPGKQQIDRLQFQGAYARDSLTLQGEMNTPAVQSAIPFTVRIPVRLSFRPPQFEIRQADELNGDFKFAGFHAATLLPLLPFLSKAGGDFHGEAHVGGTLKQPVVNGSGTWKNGFFQETRWPHVIENIQAEWQADSRNLYVKKAEAQHLGAKVSVTGFVDYPAFETMKFQATGSDLQVPEIYGIEGKVSGQAEIRQTPDTAELTGTLHFSKARMNLGLLETDIAKSIEIIEAAAKGDVVEIKDAKSPSRFYNQLKMDVGLELPPQGTWVTGKGLKAEIAGGLKLGKAPGGPIKLTGELRALRGAYSFQGKELKITEGTLIFTGAPQPDPQLRIVCQKEVKDITLQALVSGPLSRPKLAMSSVPAMNQVDILSYFMFGHSAGDLSAGEKTQLQNGAAAWLGSETSKVLKSVFGSSPLAPDSVGYRSTTGKSEHGFTNRPDPVTGAKETGIVEIGKNITPELHVTYGRGVTGEQANEVQIEYRLNRRFSIQTQVGGADQTGIDVFWRHDFGK
ncbi:MAG: translocation/assembly module TamB [Syntrophobacteraceae bacterium]